MKELTYSWSEVKDNAPILLIEDDDVDVEIVKRAFKRCEIKNQLYVTCNGEDGLNFLSHNGKYSNEINPRPGVILLDINMPIMNGIEFLKVIKNDDDFKSIPVVVLTTSGQPSDVNESFELGVAGYFIKSLEFDEFTDAVSTISTYWTLSELKEVE